MSVLIKSMEMPKNCLACKLRGDGSDSRYIWDCPFTGFEYTREEGETGRLDECPLVEVPAPHGRLIDADALKNYIENDGHTEAFAMAQIGREGKYFLMGNIIADIDEQPTVIEVEGME